MKGGYQVIDFGGVALSNTPVTIKGVYNKAKTGKAILIENASLDGAVVSGFGIAHPGNTYVTVSTTFATIVNDTPVVASLIINITNEDRVTAMGVTLAQAT